MAKRILVMSETWGNGDDELGRILMRNFFYALARNDAKPLAVLFANSGVRLTCEGSEVLDDLKLLAESGVAIKSCGTCLDFLKLTDALAIGEVGTMVEAVGAMMADPAVVTIA